MKFRSLFCITFFLLILFAGCNNGNEAEIKPEKTDGTFKRTVLLYIIGASNLSGQISGNINGVISGLKDADLYNNNFLIYVDDYSQNNSLINLRRNNAGKIYRDTVASFPDRNSASPEVLGSIIDKMHKDYDSEKYSLILWGHGTGWIPSSWEPTKSYGGDRGKWLELKDLENAIPDKLFDYILFDACFMASTEVVYQLKNKSDYMIASSAEIMGAGFPYANVASSLLAYEPPYKSICDAFYETYNAKTGESKTATISWIDVKKINNLASVTKEILRNHISETAISLNGIQRFDRSSNINVIYDLEDYIKNIANDNEFELFQEVMSEVVLYKLNTEKILSRIVIKSHGGLTTYPYYSLYAVRPGLYLHKDFKETDWYKAVYE